MHRLISILLSLMCFAITVPQFAQVRVKGYTKRDGTYVAPHYRSNPNSTKLDNWSTKGNINPYTGEAGTKKGVSDKYKNYTPGNVMTYGGADLDLYRFSLESIRSNYIKADTDWYSASSLAREYRYGSRAVSKDLALAYFYRSITSDLFKKDFPGLLMLYKEEQNSLRSELSPLQRYRADELLFDFKNYRKLPPLVFKPKD